MNEIIAFFFAVAISFWGSLQLGPVNVCVIQTALAHGKRQALIVATGGVLPELIYSSLAVWGATTIEHYPVFLNIFGWMVVVLLLALGLYYLFKPYRPVEVKPSGGSGFAKGFLLAFFNPQLFPFWLGVLVYLKGFINFGNNATYIAFITGTAAGAWVLLFVFTSLAIAYGGKLNRILKHNLNKILGCLFILLALVELIRRIYHLLPLA